MKDFEITVLLKDNQLLIIEKDTIGVEGFVNSEEGLLHCIKNYIEIYHQEKGEKK